jgi:hypothetical protein
VEECQKQELEFHSEESFLRQVRIWIEEVKTQCSELFSLLVVVDPPRPKVKPNLIQFTGPVMERSCPRVVGNPGNLPPDQVNF